MGLIPSLVRLGLVVQGMCDSGLFKPVFYDMTCDVDKRTKVTLLWDRKHGNAGLVENSPSGLASPSPLPSPLTPDL